MTLTSYPIPGWLKSVHHDGSDLYVSNLYPRMGEVVQVRLRVDLNAPVKQVYVRIFPDGEQSFIPMESGGDEPPVQWWLADLAVTEPTVHYRFLIEANDGIWFYSAAGPSVNDPLDAFDFRLLADYHSPGWLRKSVFYQIFPDRFDNGDPSNDPQPDEFEFNGHRPQTYSWGADPAADQPFPMVFYGGDLQGIRQRLDYLEKLGVTGLYLTPIFTAYSNHKYDVVDYDRIDSHFGGDSALIALRQALIERGMHYIMDIVPNHAGYWHSWFEAARADINSPEAEFFTFKDHPDEYASWLGVWTLPKLNYASPELRQRIYAGPEAVFRRWLRPPFSADGWRVDVANMLARQGPAQMGAEIARGIRQAVKETNPDAYLIGENFFDASPQLQGDQWDGVMNYMGFMKPLLAWLRGYQQGAHGLKNRITSTVPWPTEALEATWRERRAVLPWVVALQQYNLLDSHDTPRVRSVLNGQDRLHRLAVLIQFTYPGIPGLYYGDEIGMMDNGVLGPRGCMVWDETTWDSSLLNFFRELIAFKKSSSVLQSGGFQILAMEQDLIAFQRHSRDGRILVVANRSPDPFPAGALPVSHCGIPDGSKFIEHFSGLVAEVHAGALWIPELQQGGTLWIQT